jgi:hypothetical protein
MLPACVGRIHMLELYRWHRDPPSRMLFRTSNHAASWISVDPERIPQHQLRGWRIPLGRLFNYLTAEYYFRGSLLILAQGETGLSPVTLGSITIPSQQVSLVNIAAW